MTEYQLGVHIGQRVKTLREKRGLSVEQLSARADCGKGTLLSIEHGTSMPSVRRLYKLAQMLGVQPGDLLPKMD